MRNPTPLVWVFLLPGTGGNWQRDEGGREWRGEKEEKEGENAKTRAGPPASRKQLVGRGDSEWKRCGKIRAQVFKHFRLFPPYFMAKLQKEEHLKFSEDLQLTWTTHFPYWNSHLFNSCSFVSGFPGPAAQNASINSLGLRNSVLASC